MISVLILTKNEEFNLPKCLDALVWCNDIHVYDSFSTDSTLRIAEDRGAHVAQRRFNDFASQRNSALKEAHFANPWVLVLDADERLSEGLVSEMRSEVGAAGVAVGGFRVRRRDYYNDVWLKHAQLSPLFIRIIRPNRVRYTRAVNELIEVDGSLIDLVYPLLHYPFSRGVSHWLTKHNTYSTMEAELIVSGTCLQTPSLLNAFTASDMHIRRLHQKALFYKLPLRPLIKLLYMLFIRGALLDGRAGLSYSILQSLLFSTCRCNAALRAFVTGPDTHAQQHTASHQATQSIVGGLPNTLSSPHAKVP